MGQAGASLYSGAQVKQIDKAAIDSGSPGAILMKRAGRAAFEEIVARWPGHKLCVLCGGGNNGGDGYIVAALAKQQNIEVVLFYAKAPDSLRFEAADAARYAKQEAVPMQPLEEGVLQGLLSTDTVIVDAILGTGVAGCLSAEYLDAINWINACSSKVFSIDVPSGICSASGHVADACVQADVTMSFIGRKCGLYTAAGPHFSGERVFDSLGIEDSILNVVEAKAVLLDALPLAKKLQRARGAHKGDSGHVAVVGGEQNMAGAAAMAAEASLYSGSGLTSLFTRPENVSPAQSRLPEVMVCGVRPDQSNSETFTQHFDRASVICAGPGLGTGQWSSALFEKVLSSSAPKVLDADALNLLATYEKEVKAEDHILTPHPGEAARLLGTDVSNVQKDRFSAVKALQKKYGGVVILKGSGTLITDGDLIWLCSEGNPGMAVGGMGDILAGVIAALLAQGLSLLEAAQLGVQTHSFAADCLAGRQGEIGMRATELFTEIRSILNGKTDLSC